MQAHYEINVSLNGRHFFATAERSCTTEADAAKVAKEIAKRFPELEGFRVTVSHVRVAGLNIPLAALCP